MDLIIGNSYRLILNEETYYDMKILSYVSDDDMYIISFSDNQDSIYLLNTYNRCIFIQNDDILVNMPYYFETPSEIEQCRYNLGLVEAICDFEERVSNLEKHFQK